MNTRRDRLPEIDWLKGFAILSVLFIHTRLFDGNLFFAHVINRAVGIFLVLFGVTSELWWHGAAIDRASAAARMRAWYGTRLTRLMVAMWASFALWWAAVISLALPGAQPLDWQHLLASALGYMPWVGTTWFVTLVLQLVVLFPLIRALCLPNTAWLSLALAAAATGASAMHQWDVIDLARRWFDGGLGVSEPGWQYYWMFVPRVLWHVTAGVYVARRWDGRPPAAVTLVATAVTLLGVPLVAFVQTATPDAVANHLHESALYLWLDVPLTIALLGALRRVPLPQTAQSFLAFCGRASWGIYLGHVLVDEFVHLLGYAPRSEHEIVHAAYLLVLLVGASGLVLVGAELRSNVGATVDRVRRRAKAEAARSSAPLIARGFALMACAITLLTLTSLALRDWIPAFDDALIWLHVLDVGGRHTPLVGVYSRFGWSHPGPVMYYALALPLRLLGTRPSGLLIAVLLVALVAAVVLVLRVGNRAGASVAFVCALGCAVVAVGLREHVINPWNPFILVFPFALFVAAIWLWSDGDHGALPIAALAGSFAAQSHVGVVPVIVALCATAIALRTVWRPPLAEPADGRRAQRSALLVMALLWTPPFIAEVTAPSGNLRRVAQFFLSPARPDEVIGLMRGLGIAAAELAPWGGWLGRQQIGMMGDVLPAPVWHVAWPLGAIALAAAIGALRRDRLVLRLSILLFVAVVACVFSYARIRGFAFSYLVVWVRAIAMFCMAAPLIALARSWDRPQPNATTAAAARTTTLRTWSVALLLAVFAVRAIAAPTPDAFRSRVVERFADAIASAVPPHTLVRAAALGPPFTVSAESVAIVLLRAGRKARLAVADPSVPGPHRCAASDAVLPTIALAAGPGIEIYRAQGGRVIAEFDPLWPAHRAEANELRTRLEAQLVEGKREDLVTPLRDAAEWLPGTVPASVDQRALARFLELAAGLDHLAFAVFAFPPMRW